MSKLVSISDVNGAGVVRADGSIVSWHAEEDIRPTEYIDHILNMMSRKNQESVHNCHHGMFRETIVNYNGHKILASKIGGDALLMLVLERNAFLGLTMLDVECYLGDIEKALDVSCSCMEKTQG